MIPEPSRGLVLESALAIARLAEIRPTDLAVVCAAKAHSHRALSAITAARGGDPWGLLPDSPSRPGWSIVLCTIEAARAAFGRASVPEGQGPRVFVLEREGLRVREMAAPTSTSMN